jgi:hypothetical protein
MDASTGRPLRGEAHLRQSVADILNLGMAPSTMQENFGDGFFLSLAATAGCATASPRPDNDSIDWTLSCKLPTRPKMTYNSKQGPEMAQKVQI